MFASRITKDVDIQDGDSVVVVTIQKLSGRSLQKAREARSAAQLSALRGASKDMLQVFRSSELDQAAEQLAAKRAREANDPEVRRLARYNDFDRECILNAGLVRWSCQDKVALSSESIADLDEDTAQRLHTAILDLSLLPLDPAMAEAELGKG